MKGGTRLAGLTAALVSAAAFAAMGFLVHVCPPSLPSAELLFIRAVVGALVLLGIARRRIRMVIGRGTRAVWLRSVFGAVSVSIYYQTLRVMTVGDATVLADMAPLFVALIALFWQREKLPRIALAGIVLVSWGAISLSLRPGLSFSAPLFALGLAGALSGAFAYLSLRQAAQRYPGSAIVWAFCVAIVMASFILPGPRWVLPHARELALTLGIAGTALVAQLSLTWSYKYLPATVASALGLTACLWGSFYEVLFLGISVSLATWVIYALMLLGVYLAQRRAPSSSDGRDCGGDLLQAANTRQIPSPDVA